MIIINFIHNYFWNKLFNYWKVYRTFYLQQPFFPAFLSSFWRPTPPLWVFPSLFFKISWVKNWKTSLTFWFVLADVSKKLILKSSANFFPSSSVTTLSGLSHLFPTNTLQTLVWALASICFIQFLIFLKEFESVTSYVKIIPWAPL